MKVAERHLQAGEHIQLSIPGIWDHGQGQQSELCDIVLTNQRLFGYIYKTFPRERLFLDALPLETITLVTLHEKSHEPFFRELQVSDGQHSIYIRAPRQKIERLYNALRAAPSVQAQSETTRTEEEKITPARTPIYGRREIRTTFERSLLAIALLFVGGICLEILGAWLWTSTNSLATGLPLCLAGLIAVITAILLRRQHTISH